MKTKDPKKVVIGTYVHSDIINMANHYARQGRARRGLDGLVERLNRLDKDIFIFDSQFERLHIGNTPNVYVAMIRVGFPYEERKDAKKTFNKVLDSGLMLRTNHLPLSPMIEQGEYNENLGYTLESRGRKTLTWLVGRFKTVDLLNIQGSAGYKSALNGLTDNY
ncbi:MAG: hypothetical protein AABX49_01535 [Nanoarchaeota archaeon]